MTLKPLSDNVLLKGVEEEKTSGGLILATANKEKPVVSSVVAVGPGTEEHPMTVAPGQKVVVPSTQAPKSSWMAKPTPS